MTVIQHGSMVASLALTLLLGGGCSDDAAEPPLPETTVLTVGVPVAGSFAASETGRYSVVVEPGKAYVIALAARTAPATLVSYGEDASFTTMLSACAAGMDAAADECRFVAGSSGHAYLAVNAGGGAGEYALLVALEPELPASPADETVELAASVLHVGQVATRGTSTYTLTGLAPSSNVSLNLFALSGDADLHIGPVGQELPCTLGHSDADDSAEGCVFAAGADGTAAFTVEGGELNQDATSYLLLAWPVP